MKKKLSKILIPIFCVALCGVIIALIIFVSFEFRSLTSETVQTYAELPTVSTSADVVEDSEDMLLLDLLSPTASTSGMYCFKYLGSSSYRDYNSMFYFNEHVHTGKNSQHNVVSVDYNISSYGVGQVHLSNDDGIPINILSTPKIADNYSGSFIFAQTVSRITAVNFRYYSDFIVYVFDITFNFLSGESRTFSLIDNPVGWSFFKQSIDSQYDAGLTDWKSQGVTVADFNSTYYVDGLTNTLHTAKTTYDKTNDIFVMSGNLLYRDESVKLCFNDVGFLFDLKYYVNVDLGYILGESSKICSFDFYGYFYDGNKTYLHKLKEFTSGNYGFYSGSFYFSIPSSASIASYASSYNVMFTVKYYDGSGSYNTYSSYSLSFKNFSIKTFDIEGYVGYEVFSDGYNSGYKDGTEDIYGEVYNNGYLKGIEEGLTSSPIMGITAVANGVFNALNIDIFGVFSLADLLFVAVSFLLFRFAMKVAL